MDFTYDIPNEEKFLSALLTRLKKTGHEDLAKLFSRSKCTIITSSNYSKKRWNAYYTTVDFAVPQNDYDSASAVMETVAKEIVVKACDEVMPAKAGYDVMEATVSISLEDTLQQTDAMEDLKQITEQLPEKIRIVVIPDDIKAKAKVMSEVYLYTYCAENALRAFIETVAKKNYSTEYMNKLNISTDMSKKIKERKQLQEKKKWLSVRGSSDIFYLDIDDLGKLIVNNWEIFKPYFDRADWVTVNISEIADCRNQVAHHSYLEEHERNVIRDNFVKILKQIGQTFV